jgi:two-component system chemotaxis response regulator CheY
VTAKLSLQDLSILLVEPSTAQCRIIIDRLRHVGVDNIELAGNGAQALRQMAVHVPDLVLSAMYFDDMTGTELIQAMRADHRLAGVPFMLISSERHPRHLEPVRQAGVLAILPKPFEIGDLQRALYASLDYMAPDDLDLPDLEAEDLRVLVVDDSRFSLNHIIHLLRSMGVEQIRQASNGRQAAEAIRDQHFDLVITDFHMPEMDGEQLTHYIRHLSDQPDVPVLMITSEQNSARLASVQQSGVSALLDKPFDAGTVRGLLQRLLSA